MTETLAQLKPCESKDYSARSLQYITLPVNHEITDTSLICKRLLPNDEVLVPEG